MRKIFSPMKHSMLMILLLAVLNQSQAQAPGGVSSGLYFWLNGDVGTSSTVNGDGLSFWNDQSGNGRNATQSVAAARPTLSVGSMNGHNTVSFNGGTRFFNIDLTGIDNQAFTMICLVKRNSSIDNQFIMGIQTSSPDPGLHLGYVADNRLRHGQYGTRLNRGTVGYAGATETPRLFYATAANNYNQVVGEVREGVKVWAENTNTTHYYSGAQGVIGRGHTNLGLRGVIAEIIAYNRKLTDAEINQIQTYFSVKYGFTNLTTENLYYTDNTHPNDIFGIGQDLVTQGFSQTASESENHDDNVRMSNPSDLNNGEYLMVGNNNGTLAYSAYTGSSCQYTTIMNRRWSVRKTGNPGTVTLRFDMTGISGFDANTALLLIDRDNDGYDDENGITGTYSAPFLTFTSVDLPHNAKFTLAHGISTWYVVANGNASGVVWSDKPNGTPVNIPSFCATANLVVQSGFTLTNDWTSLSCANFTVQTGATFNAGAATLNVSKDINQNGTFNMQSSTVVFNGNEAQAVRGTGTMNLFNCTINNPAGVTLMASLANVRLRNVMTLTAGTLTTNGKLTLISDGPYTGMIGPLVTGDVSGNITMMRYHNMTAGGWYGLCSPIMSKTIADWNDDIVTTGFLGSDYPPPYAFNNVQYYNESVAGGMNNGFVGVTNTTNAIQDKRGYFIYSSPVVMNIDVDGAFYKGDQSLPVAYTNTGNAAGDGWNLVANPYPSTIDWDAAAWTKTNMDNAVYVWNAAIGQYATYLNGVSSNGGSRYIPSSQAFFVKANAASPVLTIRENCKAGLQMQFKSTQNPADVLTLRIENSEYSDETTLARNEYGTLSFEKELDAYKLRSPMEQVPYMASISEDGSDLSINSFNDFGVGSIIPLRMEVGVSGTYQFSHKGLTSFGRGACVVLEDLATGEVYALNNNDVISLELQAGTQDIRFQLRVSGAAITEATSAGCPGMSEGTALIHSPKGQTTQVEWMNTNGDVIYQNNTLTGSVILESLEAGIHQVSFGNNGVCGATTAEVIIRQEESITTSALVVPTYCEGHNEGGVAIRIEGGNAPFEVTWSNGEKGTSIENLAAGSYTAFVTDAKGCKGSFDYEVPSKEMVISAFETNTDVYYLHNGAVSVDFFNTSENASDFEWSFGDQTILNTESNPSHMFTAVGVYTVSLKAKKDDCESITTKTIHVKRQQADVSEFTSSIIGQLTENGVQLMFFFDEEHQIKINAYNVLGQQLIEPITGTYSRQTVTFSDKRYAANALIEVTDLTTGERALIKLGR